MQAWLKCQQGHHRLSRLSLTPEYFSKVLHELEAESLIKIDKRDIHIIDAARLKHYGLR